MAIRTESGNYGKVAALVGERVGRVAHRGLDVFARLVPADAPAPHMSDKAQREAMALLAAKPDVDSQQKPQPTPSAPMVPPAVTIQYWRTRA